MKTVEASEQTGLALLAPAAEKSRKNMHERNSNFLPRFKIVHPMEIDLADFHHRSVISSGGALELCAAPYRVSALVCRKAVRETYRNDKGEDTSRSFFEDGKTAKEYEDAKAKAIAKTPGFKLGKSYLLAIFPKPNQVTIVDGSFFGGTLWYWEKNLGRADHGEGAILEVLIDNHKENFDKKFKSWDGKKFTAVKQHEINVDENALIDQALKDSAAAVTGWLQR